MKVRKPLLAFFLGLICFVLLWALGETLEDKIGEAAGLIAAFVVIGTCLFICQFFLSRGNPGAYRRDWPIMLALDSMFLLLVLVIVLQKNREDILVQGLGILIFCCGGT
jgi:asparagine N-glycosylation enzyme membrane subunit Stt3